MCKKALLVISIILLSVCCSCSPDKQVLKPKKETPVTTNNEDTGKATHRSSRPSSDTSINYVAD